MLSLSSRLISRIVVRPEVAADDVAAQRQRQAGLLLPPHAEVDDQVQPLVLEGELPLVDDQARRRTCPAATAGMIWSNGTTS